jgi:hypothetical protein
VNRKPKSTPADYLVAACFVVLLPILVPLILIWLALWVMNWILVHAAVRMFWLPRGKSVLFVHSDSPIWKDYVASDLLPLIGRRAYVLNWSERKRWSRWSFPGYVFKTLAGEREFNPLVIVFFPLRTEYFRFWNAFRDAKRGDVATLNALMTDLRENLR